MTIKAILAELKEAMEDLKAIQRLAETTDIRQAKNGAMQRIRGIADALSQKDIEFEENAEPGKRIC